MDTTPQPTGEPASGSLPHRPEHGDEVEHLADLDPAEAPDAAEALARRLAEQLDAEAVPSPADGDQGQSP